MKNKKIKLSTILGVIFGNMLYAFTVKFFLLPSDMMSSGTTGISLIVNHLTGFDIPTFILIFNITMLIVGFFFFGKEFVMTTIASSIIYPLSLDALNELFPEVYITDNMLLNVLFTGMGIGLALGIVIRSGASTGGMDIPPLVLKKLFNIPVSVSLYAFDFIIITAQVFYHPIEDLLYGILLLIITSVMLDKVLLFGESKTEVKIVSERSDEIRNHILSKIDRGVTVLYGEGGYSKEKKDVILTVLSNRELAIVERTVHDIDPDAFVIVSKVTQVYGRGFSAEKKYISKEQ
ncbi:MAG: YitT family protein [Eubacteriaceae bacterium]|nr:YitT family protein [Eubacteriaceae bacterium]